MMGCNLRTVRQTAGTAMTSEQVQPKASAVRPQEVEDQPGGLLQLAFVAFMVFEIVFAIMFGGWLGDELAAWFTGVWQSVVFWFVCITGTVLCWCSFVIGFGCLFNFLRSDEPAQERCEKGRPSFS